MHTCAHMHVSDTPTCEHAYTHMHTYTYTCVHTDRLWSTLLTTLLDGSTQRPRLLTLFEEEPFSLLSGRLFSPARGLYFLNSRTSLGSSLRCIVWSCGRYPPLLTSSSFWMKTTGLLSSLITMMPWGRSPSPCDTESEFPGGSCQARLRDQLSRWIH